MTRTRPVRVAHVITKLAVGGAQESALTTCLGIEPDVAEQWLLSGTEVDAEGSLRPTATAAGLRVVDVPALGRSVRPDRDAAALLALRRHFRSEQPDIVHTHSSKAGLIGRLAARWAGVPVVVHSVHGWSYNDEMRRPVRRAVVAAERVAARATTALVVEARPDLAKGLAAGIGRPEQYVVIRNGIDLSAFSTGDRTARASVRAELGVPDRGWVVGTIGRLAEQKNPLGLVDAVAELRRSHPDCWLVWVGDGPLRAAAEARAVERGIAANVRFTGVRRDVPALLGAFDAFALSSLWEGLPRTVTEALSAGVPVAATAVDGVAEVIEDGVHGLLVRSHDPVALGLALARLHDDDDLRGRLVAAGRERSRLFDRVEMLRRVRSLYEGLTAGRSPAAIARGFTESTPLADAS